MNDEVFSIFSTLVRNKAGIVLTRDKAYLLESRLLPVARKHRKESLDALSRDIGRGAVAIEKDVVEALTTNESFFFRDTLAFERFRQVVLPTVRAQRAATRKFRIWSAASSSGQELYSIAMLIKEDGSLRDWAVDLLGTDLSTEMVERARAGSYSHFEVQRGLPIQYLAKYFTKTGDSWTISAAMRNGVKYRPYNLLDDYAQLGAFDVIFCRNVLIYFDTPTKASILERMSRLLNPGGFLFLGGAETVLGVTDRFTPFAGNPGVYVVAKPAVAPARVATR